MEKTSTNNVLSINRQSLTTNLLERYKKSKDSIVPRVVDFFANTFAKGFTLKQSTTAIDLNKQSNLKQGFNNTRYK